MLDETLTNEELPTEKIPLWMKVVGSSTGALVLAGSVVGAAYEFGSDKNTARLSGYILMGGIGAVALLAPEAATNRITGIIPKEDEDTGQQG